MNPGFNQLDADDVEAGGLSANERQPGLLAITNPTENDPNLLARCDNSISSIFGTALGGFFPLSFRNHHSDDGRQLMMPAIASTMIAVLAIAILCVNNTNNRQRGCGRGLNDFAIGMMSGTLILWFAFILLNNSIEQDVIKTSEETIYNSTAALP
jgi:hypothetical protein